METALDGRVLVLMPTARDEEWTCRVLAEAGLDCVLCEDIDHLCREFARGAGVAVLSEEAIEGDPAGRLQSALKEQPPWSDFPLVVLTREGEADAPIRDTMNVILVERPVRVRSLLSVIRAALRSRRRQYECRDHVGERRRAEESQAYLAKLAETLRPLSAPEDVQEAACRILGEHLGANRVAYFEVTGPEYVVERDYAVGVRSVAGRYSVASFGSTLMEKFHAGQIVVETDATTLPSRRPDERAAFAAIRVRGHVDVPLVKAGAFVAGMTVHFQDAREWTAEEVALIEQTAERTWAAVERAKAERALRAGEERFRSLFESMDEGYCVVEPMLDKAGRAVDYRYILANPALEQHTGLREVVGRTALEVMPAHESYWIEAYARVAATGEPFRRTDRVEDLGRWYEVSAFPVGGGQVGVLFADVTARREAEEGLRASEARLAEIFRHAPSFMAVLSGADHVFERMNDGYLEVIGGRDVVGMRVREAIPEIEDQGYFEVLDQVYRTGEPYFATGHRVVLRRDGRMEERILDFVYQPLRDASGAVTGVLAQGIDTTERWRAEHELRDIRSRMETALAAGAIGTWSWDVTNDRFYGDPSLARIFAVPASAVAGGPLAGLMNSIHHDDRDRVGRLVNQAVEAGGRYEADYRVTDGAGGWRWVNARGQVERDHADQMVRFPGVVIEVTDRKRAEEALGLVKAESERRTRLYEAVLSTTPDLAYVWGLDHRFSYANEGLLRMWGKTWDEAIGKNCLELGYEPWHAEMHDREIEEVRATRTPLRGEVPFAGTFGRRIYDYILMPVIGADGEVEAVAGITRDVTERKEMEQELRDQDRKKDDFIALLAHELRNPLAPIRNSLNVMRLAGADHEVLREPREIMERQITHMVRLIDDLLDVSRINRNKMDLRLKRVTLAGAVNSALETARPLIDAGGHELIVSIPDRPIYLEADLTRLAQVFSNLLTNSAKYTRYGGKIWLTAERRGEEIAVSVRDNGIGIPAAAMENIFNMFSQVDRSVERTTGGLGIGLALVKGLVEMHGGTVAGASGGEGQGSTFTVILPIVASAGAPVSTRKHNGQTDARRRILIVDDSRDGAHSLARMLSLMGNDVRTANDGLEGIELAGEFRPEVVLMDVGMPVLNGLDATRRIREQSWGREMTIIALTGWGQEGDKERSREAGCDGHLVKPVDLDDLLVLLRVKRT